MDLEQMIAALSDPAAFPGRVDRVDVVQTHISAVFLAGDRAYKVKKPVNLGFLDFTTLERRRHFCHEEVRLNRRLAPDVYLDVVPVVEVEGGLAVDAPGEPVEYAVVMRRLPEERTFESLLTAGALGESLVRHLAARIAEFHGRASCGPAVSRWGGFDTVAGNARENFEQIRPWIGDTITETAYERLSELTEAELTRLRPRIDDRAARHVTRDTHGDLHLRHVYSFPGVDPPGDLVVVDCIEFNERFRFADPVADVAFMVMDLRYHDRRDLADAFADAYFAASGDDEGRDLLAFYVAYRAVVRGKVDGFAARGAEIPPALRARFADRARAYHLLALVALERPAMRPALVLSVGLPGTGKTFVARQLAALHGFAPVATDRVRKELAGLPVGASAAAPMDSGIYTPEWTRRTYDRCFEQAEGLLQDGRRVVIDAGFRTVDLRERFLELARSLRVPALVLESQAPPEVVRERLQARQGDASDADWTVHQALSARWEAYGPRTEPLVRRIDTSAGDVQVRETIRLVLLEAGLA